MTNDEIVRRLFDAFARSDGFALRGVFAEDAVWVVPGRSLLAGTYNGRHEIFRFLALAPDGPLGDLVAGLFAGRRIAV